jgi:hypothetical protein
LWWERNATYPIGSSRTNDRTEPILDA